MVLQKGEQLCFKCGDKITKKSVLLNHIKTHHNDPCLKYLEGKCTYGSRCVYKHTNTIVQDVERSFANSPTETPNIYSHQDFPQVPPTEKRLVGTKNKKLIQLNSPNLSMKIIHSGTVLEQIDVFRIFERNFKTREIC